MYREIRIMTMSDLRSLCIRRNYYTHGDCKEYENLLNMTDAEQITTEIIIEMAQDILDHSETDEELTDIAFYLLSICNTSIVEA